MPTFVDGEAALSVFNKLNAVLGAAEWIASPAALVADTGFTYTAGQARTVTAGTIIIAVDGMHRYQVVASGATVFDLQTAGGVKVLLLPNGDGWFDFDGMAPFKDGTTDNLAKLNTLLTNKSQTIALGDWLGPSIRFSAGRYYFSDTINLKSRCRFHGQHTGFASVRGTDFIFPPATLGICVNRHNTLGAATVGANTGAADGSELVGIQVIGGRGDVFDETKSAFWLRARAWVVNCAVLESAGHGLYSAAGSDGNPYLGNTNLTRVSQLRVRETRGSACHIQGTDANAGTYMFINGQNCDGWCVYENSFLGNLHFGHHSESCYAGSYFSSNGSFFHGCYTEDGAGGNWDLQGIAIGNTVSAANTGGGPVLKTEQGNGPRALLNAASGFRGTAPGETSTHTTDIATEADNILSSRHSITGISSPLRWMWEATASGTFLRYASQPDRLMNLGRGDSGGAYGRTGAVGPHVNIPRLFVGLNANARQITYGSAAPTTGEWARGDIVFNNAPSANGRIGWVCVTGGTPGTWKPWGAIDP